MTALLAFAVVAGTASAALTPAERALVRAVNRARATYGLQPVHVDTRLERAAREHSRDMVRRDYFAHGAFPSRMAAVHAPGRFQAENIAWGTGPFGTAEGIVHAWLASPPHRENLLRPGFSRIGIGAVRGSFLGYSGTTVVTADFAGSH